MPPDSCLCSQGDEGGGVRTCQRYLGRQGEGGKLLNTGSGLCLLAGASSPVDAQVGKVMRLVAAPPSFHLLLLLLASKPNLGSITIGRELSWSYTALILGKADAEDVRMPS